MARIALGWIGWTEEQALSADVNSIIVAFEGRQDMLKAVFGGGEDSAPASPVSERPMSGELFDALFGG